MRLFNSYALRRWTLASVLVAGVTACQDLTGSQTLDGGAVDPSGVKNAAAAYRLAYSARVSFQVAFADFIVKSGVFTDELQSVNRGGTTTPLIASDDDVHLDARYTSRDVSLVPTLGNGSSLYAELHRARGMSIQAIGALKQYAGDSSAAAQALLFAYRAYAEVLLADFYCSGVPLSTWDFDGDFTYRGGSTTTEVYTHAAALFDTALVLADDSLPIMNLARVGKARALLALGRFETARAVAQLVPEDFVYAEPVYTCYTASTDQRLCRAANLPPSVRAMVKLAGVSVGNGDGGQSTISPQKPRTTGRLVRTTRYGFPVYLPEKYGADMVNPLVLASGTEAVLIRAEGALHMDDIPEWLRLLNGLRASSPLTDTMPPISDPGGTARVDTLFSERAQWLFLTGHRQGDLRRLLRQDPTRLPETVYPSGSYPGGMVFFGTDVTLPINYSEESANPLFRGCFDRRA